MATNIVELFGYAPLDHSTTALRVRRENLCPFVGKPCIKTLNDGTISGVCSIKPANAAPVVICPIRLYTNEYRILLDVAERAFGADVNLIHGDDPAAFQPDHKNVVVFGKGWGKELRLPARRGRGAFFVDWVLALIGQGGQLEKFVAAEVQSIDTTGTYRPEREAYLRREAFTGTSTAGLNWENVSKRILPQLIFKGHVLRREPLCQSGLFFICPTAVYQHIRERLGGELLAYELQPGTLTFRTYSLGPAVPAGQLRELVFDSEFTTTVDQVATAFTSPTNLPPPKVYEEAIRQELDAEHDA